LNAAVPPLRCPPPQMGIVIATLEHPAGEALGVQTHFTEFHRYLVDVGDRVDVVTPFSNRGILRTAVFAPRRAIQWLHGPSGVVWYRWGHLLFLRTALRRHLADGRPTTVYAQCPLSAAAALRARKNTSQSVAMVVHYNRTQADEFVGKGAVREGGLVWSAVRRTDRRILPKLDGIVYVSRFARAQVENSIPEVRNAPCAIVPNFISWPSPSKGEDYLADAVTVGRLEPRKNQEYLLDVLAAGKKLGSIFTLTVIGDGPNRVSLEARASALGIADQVRFLRHVDRSHARQLLRRHRLYVHSARIENLPMVVLEALCAGLPVLTAPVGGIPEVVRDGIEGRYWNLEDPAGGAVTLAQMLNDPVTLARMSRSATTRFETEYETSVVAPRLRRFLFSLPASNLSVASPAGSLDY
jgi:glycosyltransferase involved in cell wall biosynthesis